MKLLICLAIVVASISLGATISINLKKKKYFWTDMVKLCEVISSNIGFGQKKISEILFDYAKSCDKELKKIINLFLLSIKNKQANFCLSESIFSDEEAKNISEFFGSFGELDVYNELGRIENYKKIFVSYKSKSEAVDAKYSLLIVKLSLVFGILICILFV